MANSEWPKLSQLDVNVDGRRLVKECLESSLVGNLATHDEKGSWSTPVFFTFDENFNIYFVSLRATRHMMSIIGDNSVGFSVFMPLDKSKDVQIGVQIQGLAISIRQEEVEAIYTERERRLKEDTAWTPKANEAIRLQMQGGVFMRIKPMSLFYVNTSLFGGDRKQVPLNTSDGGVL